MEDIDDANAAAVARELWRATSLCTPSDPATKPSSAMRARWPSRGSCGTCPNLHTLELPANDIDDVSAGAAAPAELRTFDFGSNNSMGDAGVTAIAQELRHLPSLHTLKLKGNTAVSATWARWPSCGSCGMRRAYPEPKPEP
eukprot:CAMPEP_0118852520 /NCGR_PEP_ID=MMETSP1163-20130328/1491_1 /TAXON_ID=124430 /ORGANISM="Phaeomonas parva, Strain CCMP2877" /LENGTH=141 /DNA_ID=CAMNT_0006784955 /DNA_START=995 /DNA_END=1421 /DNA_ORIENTATION=+